MTVKRFVPAILWLLISTVLLCLPGSAIPKNSWFSFPYADKFVHIMLFFLLCFLFARPLGRSAISTAKRKNYFLLILISGITYGIAMEFVQKYWIPNRSFEMTDIFADSAGCLAAYLFSLWNFSGKG